MPQFPLLTDAVAIALIVLASAVLRGLTGFGFALTAVPLLSLVLEPVQAVALTVLVQAAIGLRDLLTHKGEWDGAILARLGTRAVLGTPIGVLLLLWVDPAVARLAIAALIVAGLVLMLRSPTTAPKPPDPMLGVVVGAVSGVFGGFAAMPGPPVVAYLLNSDMPSARVRVSLIIFFFATSVLTVPGLVWGGAVTVHTVGMALCLIPVTIGGTWVGHRLFLSLGDIGYRRIAIMVLTGTAIAASMRGLSGLLY
ncbi:membrane protein [Primorskyibacter flagellatus]|uniref:Probable membrane transporter protein n=1 Tax=Primorskyibacter flagellatus TaxID=1387277 RepID=A0A917EKS6_9RHOB|nr:sulfite exporter TauE/SafE family protein [Primorskyibacter flagellatus]GGE50295.1 membrane protein [Primorskyibacter flagellatus]